MFACTLKINSRFNGRWTYATGFIFFVIIVKCDLFSFPSSSRSTSTGCTKRFPAYHMHTSNPRLAQGEAFRRAQQKKKQQTINSAQCVKLFENIRADVSVNNESSVLFRNASPHSAFILRLETHTMCPQPFAFFF